MKSDFGSERKMMMRPTGTIIAPPMPCTKRAATNIANDVDAAHSSEPAMKMPIAVRNTVREP